MRPRVLFVDESSWEAFTALAGALRRRGVGTARLTVAGQGPRRSLVVLLESLVYGVTARVSVPRGTSAPAALVRAASRRMTGLLDVQAPDDVAHALLESDPAWSRVMRRTLDGTADHELFDKAVMDEVARGRGVAVPRRLEGHSWGEGSRVVKSRRGSGGQGVWVAHSADEAQAAVREVEGRGVGPPLVQEYLPGRLMNVGAIADGASLVVAAAYRALPAADDPQGPSTSVVTVDRPDLLAVAATMVQATGYRGFLCLDFVDDADGQPHLIDVNPRAFGAWPALQVLGLDLMSAYLHILGLADRPTAHAPAAGRTAHLLRFPAPRGGRATREWVADGVGTVRAGRPHLGWRWAVVSLLKLAAGAGVSAGYAFRQTVRPNA